MSKSDEKPQSVDPYGAPSITRVPSAPLVSSDALPAVPSVPRGGPDDADLHRQTLDAAALLGPVPGAAEAQEALERRAAMLDLSIAQDDALPGLLVKRGVQGIAAGGAGYLFYRLFRALLGGRR